MWVWGVGCGGWMHICVGGGDGKFSTFTHMYYMQNKGQVLVLF